jgi:hypothetical protein
MKYILSESQYKLLQEQQDQKPFLIHSIDHFGGWDGLQKFLKYKGNPDYRLGEYLNLTEMKIESLGNLISIDHGGLYLSLSYPIKTLGKLRYVQGSCDLFDSSIESLGDLEYVGGYLDLRKTNVDSLGKLKDLYLADTELARMYTRKQIREMIKINGELIMV